MRQPGAHLGCTVCHHLLHDDPKKLPSTDPKLLAIPTGKRNADDTPVFTFAHNTCAQMWHTKSRENALREIEPNVYVYPSMSLNRFDGTTQAAASSTATNSSSAVTDSSSAYTDAQSNNSGRSSNPPNGITPVTAPRRR